LVGLRKIQLPLKFTASGKTALQVSKILIATLPSEIREVLDLNVAHNPMALRALRNGRISLQAAEALPVCDIPLERMKKRITEETSGTPRGLLAARRQGVRVFLKGKVILAAVSKCSLKCLSSLRKTSSCVKDGSLKSLIVRILCVDLAGANENSVLPLWNHLL